MSRASYGPIQLNASESGSIAINFELAKSGCFIECFVNGDSQNPTASGKLSSWASGSNVTIAGGTQSLIEFIVTNQESAVSTNYDVTIIRPLPVCAAADLSAWYNFPFKLFGLTACCRSPWSHCEPACESVGETATSIVTRTRTALINCAALLIEESTTSCGTKVCHSTLQGSRQLAVWRRCGVPEARFCTIIVFFAAPNQLFHR